MGFVHAVQYLKRSEEGIKLLRAGVTGGWEPNSGPLQDLQDC